MRRSSRTAAAMRNLRATLDSRARGSSAPQDTGLVRRLPDQSRDVDPETRRLIDEALARRNHR